MSKRKGRPILLGVATQHEAIAWAKAHRDLKPDNVISLTTLETLGINVISLTALETLRIGIGNVHVCQASPPAIGQCLIAALLSGERREAVLGDLDELLQRDRDRYGLQRARLLYTMGALQFIWPELRLAVRRLIRWGMIADVVQRFFSGG